MTIKTGIDITRIDKTRFNGTRIDKTRIDKTPIGYVWRLIIVGSESSMFLLERTGATKKLAQLFW